MSHPSAGCRLRAPVRRTEATWIPSRAPARRPLEPRIRSRPVGDDGAVTQRSRHVEQIVTRRGYTLSEARNARTRDRIVAGSMRKHLFPLLGGTVGSLLLCLLPQALFARAVVNEPHPSALLPPAVIPTADHPLNVAKGAASSPPARPARRDAWTRRPQAILDGTGVCDVWFRSQLTRIALPPPIHG